MTDSQAPRRGPTLVVAVPRDAGWSPVWRMVALLGHYLGADPMELDVRGKVSSWKKATAPIRKRGSHGGVLVLVASDPGQLNALLQRGVAAHRYERVVAWVVDSFWWDRIPRIASSGLIDRIYVTDPGDVSAWLRSGVNGVRCLPWGTDALAAARHPEAARPLVPKEVDVLRVGRQPPAWDDDRHVARAARRRGLTFHGRPSFGTTAEQAYCSLTHELARSRFVLAFSARVSPADYTHPTADYLTGRWLDALAHGCTVAGARPLSAAADLLLWDGATLELPVDDVDEGMAALAAAVQDWTPATAQRNRRAALLGLDWRWRFAELLRDIEVDSPSLRSDIDVLSSTAERMS